ncbi:MAG: hypothetical protein KDB82_01485, partial [Planctomycetes bacterium]|nr:hypothetical protein [Planctomycetota bacterium]
MAEARTKVRTLKDKLILLGLAVLIVAPFAVFFGISRQPPKVSKSASDLDKYPDDEKVLVTQGLKDEDVDALERFDQLEDLQLHYSNLTDAGLPKIAEHTTLKRLVLGAIHVSDAGVSKLAALVNLEELILIGAEGITSDGLSFLPKL